LGSAHSRDLGCTCVPEFTLVGRTVAIIKGELLRTFLWLFFVGILSCRAVEIGRGSQVVYNLIAILLSICPIIVIVVVVRGVVNIFLTLKLLDVCDNISV
jgi:hypothetical protein